MPAPQPFWLKVQVGPLLRSRPFVAGGTPRTRMEVRSGVSAWAAAIWSWDENEKDSVSNKSARVRQKPASCSVTACVLLHITHASYEGFSISFGSDKTRRQNRCPSCAGIISSCHLWGLGGGGQLLSPSPALHVESSPPFSLQTARLA